MAGTHIFAAFSDKDSAFGNTLVELLQKLIDHKYIEQVNYWPFKNDRELSVEIDRKLNESQIILLVLSQNFFGTDYYHKTYPRVINRAIHLQKSKGATVIPVIYEAVDWLGTELGTLTALPAEGKPFTSWTDKNLAYADIIQNIRHINEKITNSPTPDPYFVASSKQIDSLDAPLTVINPASDDNISTESPDMEKVQRSLRRKELEELIMNYDKTIRECEIQARLSTNLAEKELLQKDAQTQINTMKDFLQEYMDMALTDGFTVSQEILQISASFSDSGTPRKQNDQGIREQLKTFSLPELRLLGLDLGINVKTLPGNDVQSKINPLLDYLRKRSRMEELELYLRRKTPSLHL